MKLKNTTCLCAVTLMAAALPYAHAQDVNDAKQNSIQDTIIVTAPGPSRSADELIGNATALQRADIIRDLSGTLGDTLDKQPGVSTTFFGAGASRPVLRGLGAERVLVLTNGIGTIDVSAASPDHQVAADGIDAERIEILRGPAALAYGGQAIGGVVNVIDGLITEKKPEKPLSVDLFAAKNSVNDGDEISARTQFLVGDFVFTLTGSKRDFDNYDIPGFAESKQLRALESEHEDEEEHEDEHEEHEEAFGSVANSFVETNSLAAGISWIGDSGFIGVGVRHQTSVYGLPGHEHAEEHEEDEVHSEEEEEESPFVDLEQTRYDLRAGLSVNNGFLTEIITTASYADYEHIEFEGIGIPGTRFNSDGYEGRLEVGHEFSRFKGAFGAQYINKNLASVGEESFITPTQQKGLGLFLYETRDWDQGFGIEGGLRLDRLDYENENAGRANFELASASMGMHQHWENGWFIGGQLAYTERAPNESELFAYGVHLATSQFEIGNSDLKKESGLNLEGVLRWNNDNFEFGVNAFSTQFQDFIYLAPATELVDDILVEEIEGLPIFKFVQEDAQFTGGEIYTKYRMDAPVLGAKWSFNAAIDLVNAQLDSGGDVPFIPPLTLHAGAKADWDLIQFGADLTFADDQKNVGAGHLETDGYTLLNLQSSINFARLGLEMENAELFVQANNVTDEEIRFATSVLKDTVPAQGQNFRIGIRLVL